jgi:hypothetical protein
MGIEIGQSLATALGQFERDEEAPGHAAG